MNWKLLCLLSSLTLAAPLPAYSTTNLHHQTASGAVLVAQNDSQGGTMNPGDGMNHQGNSMNQGDSMKGNSMNQGSAMLKMGSEGDDVRFVQKFLTRGGFYDGPINGVFDEETRAAVIKFQNSKNITPTGIVGPTTRAAMI